MYIDIRRRSKDFTYTHTHTYTKLSEILNNFKKASGKKGNLCKQVTFLHKIQHEKKEINSICSTKIIKYLGISQGEERLT